MSAETTRIRQVRSRTGRRAVLAPLLGVFLLAACQTADEGTASSSAADEPSEAAAESAAAAAPSPEESEGGSASGDVTVTVSETSVGPALADEDGMTLYVLFNDGEDGSGCVDACEDAWPPFVIDEGTEVVAGDGVTGEFGTTTRPDGTTQVTLYTRPLYYHAGDTSPGDANGHEVGDVWFVAQQ